MFGYAGPYVDIAERKVNKGMQYVLFSSVKTDKSLKK